MRANIANIVELLEGSVQYVVPIYQRTYTWKRDQCQELWDDIERIGVSTEYDSHFFGPIVCMEPEIQDIGNVRQVLVIDGQQRLTTISLLIAAFCKVNDDQGEPFGVFSKEISNLYLFNDGKVGESRYKKILTQSDRETLMSLLEGKDLPEDFSEILRRNYRFFLSKLKNARLEIIYKGIQGLQVVHIVLDRGRDNPQMIFESLNAKGLDLSQSDLIRNYVLMGREIDFQTKLYENYWFPMEQRFRGKGAHFNHFIRYYLILKTKRDIAPGNLYRRFKELVQEDISPEILEGNLEEISRYSKYYLNIALLQEKNEQLLRCFADLHELDTAAAYPFLLKVYDFYQKGELEIDEVIKTVSLMESYILRRFVCGLPNKHLLRYFLELFGIMDEVNWMDDYLERLNEKFLDLHSVMRFPSDGAFRRGFTEYDIYEFKHVKYVLRKLEDHNRSGDPVDMSELSIERIMPETLTPEWRVELGEDYEKVYEVHLNSIGNITLTNFNSDLGNISFIEKRDKQNVGFLYSGLYLNESLSQEEEWNVISMTRRANKLAERAKEVWGYPANQ